MNSTVPAPDVADGLGRRDGGLTHRTPPFRRHAGAGRFLDQPFGDGAAREQSRSNR